MSFKTEKYQVIQQVLPTELSNFIFNYMLVQRDAVDLMMKHKKVSPTHPFIGTRTDPQVPGCYAKYADWVMETLLMYMIPMKKEIFYIAIKIDQVVKFLQLYILEETNGIFI